MKLLNKIDFRSVFYLILVSQGVFSKAIKKGGKCEKDFGEEAEKDIKDISKKLNISTCDAGNVYNYVVKGEEYFETSFKLKFDSTFSESKCKKKCKKANQKLMKEFKNADVDKIQEDSKNLLGFDYMTSCESNCHQGYLNAKVLKESNTESKEEDESELKNLEKRDEKPCDPVDQGKIEKTSSEPYNFSFYRYTQKSDSAKTAISVVNGCGPKNNEEVSKIVGNLAYADEFTPACNSHDICYTCHRIARKECDDAFKNNMKQICSYMFDVNSFDNFITKAKKLIKKAECNSSAVLFADTVSLLGPNSYTDTPVNTSTECAACGVEVIKESLYNTPFYVLK